jgi:dipeptidase D
MITIENLEPKIVWDIFHNITKHPRPSKKEEKIVKYIEDFANNLKLKIKKDTLGNLVISKPATEGYENHPGVCIQAHVDMVTEKNRDVEFDFDNDPIQTYVEDGWLKAKGTTLGADNGIGLAMGMAVLASDNVKHPPFELLCTLDEETGLTGALELGTDLLDSKILINLDTEDFGLFTIGCAGGMNTKASIDLVKEKLGDNYKTFELYLKGLKGGHSGIEIHDERGNAAKIINRFLIELNNSLNLKLHSIDSGDKHNAIPREAYVRFSIPDDQVESLKNIISIQSKVIDNEWKFKEPDLEFGYNSIESIDDSITLGTQEDILNVINGIPHGVIRFTPEIPELVQTSNNLASVKTSNDKLEILTSQRSIIDSERDAIASSINSILELGGFNINKSAGYPAWEPLKGSELVDMAVKTYKDDFNSEPTIEIIHAGLECGLIGEKYPQMEMLSFGPTIKEVHTPNEKVEIQSVDDSWKLLVSILEKL